MDFNSINIGDTFPVLVKEPISRDVLTCSGKVKEKIMVDGKEHIRLSLSASNQYGEEKLNATALIDCYQQNS